MRSAPRVSPPAPPAAPRLSVDPWHPGKIIAPCLIVLALGCQSPEERACENTVRIIAQSGATDDRPGADKSEKQRYRDCLESLGRLRQQIQPDEDVWFAYLRCLTAADSMKAQFDCLAPLAELQMQANTPPADR